MHAVEPLQCNSGLRPDAGVREAVTFSMVKQAGSWEEPVCNVGPGSAVLLVMAGSGTHQD